MAESKSQQHTLTVDKKREKVLKKAGWRIIHIWEHEVDNQATQLRLRKEVMPCVS
jgi:very-short-patch-repair endonuclease